MELVDLLDLCREYNHLGWAVQEQLQSLIDGGDIEDLNINAVRRIGSFLQSAVRAGVEDYGQFAELVSDYLAESG